MEILLAVTRAHIRKIISRAVNKTAPDVSCTHAIIDSGKIFNYIRNNHPSIVIIEPDLLEAIVEQGLNWNDVENIRLLVLLEKDNLDFLDDHLIYFVSDFLISSSSKEELEKRIMINLISFRNYKVSFVSKEERSITDKKHKELLEFVSGNLVHDLKNLLTMLTGNVSLARYYLETGEEEKMHAKLKYVEEASEQARGLIQNTLSYVRLNKTEADLKKLVKETAEAAGNAYTRPVFQFTDNVHKVEVDVNAIKQVVNNLMLNAVQAMPEGGDILLKMENVEVENKGNSDEQSIAPGSYVRISVKDKGVGIPDDQQQNIFKPFFSTKEEGSGLGLASSYYIVKRHGGDIQVSSREGEGTTFYVYLPATEQE